MRRKVKKVLVMAVAVTTVLSNVLSVSAAGVRDVFNAKYYADTYADLATAFGYDEEALYQHYMTFGIAEGRSGSPVFDVLKYREAYGDLDAAFGENWDAYVEHYFTHGMNEGRISGGVFDPIAYAEAYPDLQAAFGNDIKALTEHYLNYGIAEGRTAGVVIITEDGEQITMDEPTAASTTAPTAAPTTAPTAAPTTAPTVATTTAPTATPTATPTPEPTEESQNTRDASYVLTGTTSDGATVECVIEYDSSLVSYELRDNGDMDWTVNGYEIPSGIVTYMCAVDDTKIGPNCYPTIGNGCTSYENYKKNWIDKYIAQGDLNASIYELSSYTVNGYTYYWFEGSFMTETDIGDPDIIYVQIGENEYIELYNVLFEESFEDFVNGSFYIKEVKIN